MTVQSSTLPNEPFIDRRWVTGESRIEVKDVAGGGRLGTVHAASPEQAAAAIDAAERGAAAMKETTIPQRAAWCEAIAADIRDRRDRLARIVVREAGKPIAGARSEVEAAAERFDRAAEEIRSVQGEYFRGTTAGHEGWEAMSKFEPVGIVLCIAPYNYPLGTTALQVAPALAAGNAVVLKPSSRTPYSGAILADSIAGFDLPEGAFNYVPGDSGEIGPVIAGDERVELIAMTGSSSGGRTVAGHAGITALHMELGGNAPAIVFDDADLDEAAAACAKGGFSYAGQRCSAVSRVLVHEAVEDDFLERLTAETSDWTVGDPFDETTKLGPLIDEEQARWVESLLDDAVERGATVVTGGERDGNVIEPTILAGVPRNARILVEEQFGPILPVTPIESEADAIELANAGDLALDSCVFTTDYDRAMAVADAVEAGSVRINGAPSHGLGDIPFGGRGASGIGREGLGTTIQEMMRKKSVIL